MPTKVSRASNAANIVEKILLTEVEKLDQLDKVKIEQPGTVKNYTLGHARGALLILYGGSSYSKTDERNNAVIMKRDIVISIVVWIRHFDKRMAAADYIDFVLDAVTEEEIDNTRPEYERKIYPIDDELVEEKNGEWQYIVRVGVPTDYVERKYKQ
ncbi:MAG: hypothetical protein KF816_11395 [Melioribacteraceae bacterium]|nr:hypothetical protein [Melioribacteraceae bacterium]